MKILVIAPMARELENFNSALLSFSSLKHTYKAVSCDVGKAFAAATVGVELSKASYDLVAVVGYAGASVNFSQGDILCPSACRYHDADCPEDIVPELTQVFPLIGKDDCLLLSGDAFITPSKAEQLFLKYGRNVMFDMEAGAVCQISQLHKTPVAVIKLVSDTLGDGKENIQSYYEFSTTHKDFTPFVKWLETL